jgi:hypothetical protein
MTPIEQAIEALEDACGNRCNAEYNPCHYREAIDALRAQPDNTNAPWLTKAHMLCTDHGVPQGHIEWRIDVLRELLEAQKLPEVPSV